MDHHKVPPQKETFPEEDKWYYHFLRLLKGQEEDEGGGTFHIWPSRGLQQADQDHNKLPKTTTIPLLYDSSTKRVAKVNTLSIMCARSEEVIVYVFLEHIM